MPCGVITYGTWKNGCPPAAAPAGTGPRCGCGKLWTDVLEVGDVTGDFTDLGEDGSLLVDGDVGDPA